MSPRRLLFVAWGLVFAVSVLSNYCGTLLCPKGRHVACGAKPKEYGKECSIDAELLPMNDKLRDVILRRFNELRNEIAGGGFTGFTPANRMATLSWDKELAYLAEFNVLKCRLHRDDCRNTFKYGHVGQTVSYKGYRKETPELDTIVTTQINVWFRELESSSMDEIFKYMGPSHGKPNENFLQMVMAENDRVGCAVLQQTENDWLQTFLTCNYAKAPVVGKLVFETGTEGGISCETGKDPTYWHLCSIDENYNNKKLVNKRTTSAGDKKPTTAKAIKSRGKPAATTPNPKGTDEVASIPMDIYGLPISIPYWSKGQKKKMLKHLFHRFIRRIKLSQRPDIVITTSNLEVKDESKNTERKNPHH